jgi:hypothetical protein
MSKTYIKNSKKVTIPVIIIGIGIWAYNLGLLWKSGAVIEREPVAERSVPVMAKAAAAFIYNDKLKDPFRPSFLPKAGDEKKTGVSAKPIAMPGPARRWTPPPYRVDGIMWNPKNPMAILMETNTKETFIVNPGKKVGEMEILRIDQKSVTVKYMDSTLALP